MRVLAAVATAVFAIALGLPAGVLAHGDPASHSLETERLYVSFTAVPSAAVQLQLHGYLNAAEKAGSPMSVSLVAAEVDVIEDPSMLRKPQQYAEFVSGKLAEELERPVGEPVVVVTPYGMGISGHMLSNRRFGPVSRAAARKLVRGVELHEGADGDELARAAIVAIRRIASAGGNPLPARVAPAKVAAPVPYEPPGDGNGAWAAIGVFAAIFGGAALFYEVLARSSRRRRPRSVAGELPLEPKTNERA